jgi:hypothetical protein
MITDNLVAFFVCLIVSQSSEEELVPQLLVVRVVPVASTSAYEVLQACGVTMLECVGLILTIRRKIGIRTIQKNTLEYWKTHHRSSLQDVS